MIIRKIYLYLFSLIGLMLIVISSINFVDLGLRAFVFTESDLDVRLAPVKLEEVCLTSEEKNEMDRWVQECGRSSYLDSRQQREVSKNLAMLTVGTPLYHWSVVRDESD